MRAKSWLPIGLMMLFPAAFSAGACGPIVDTVPTGGAAGEGGAVNTTSTTTGGSDTTTTTTTGGGGSGGTTGGGGTGGTGGGLPPENDACNGQKIDAQVGMPTAVDGTLIGAKDDLQTFCADTTDAADKADVVYELAVPADVTATFTINATGFNPALSIRNQDCNGRFAGDACLVGTDGILSTKLAMPQGPAWLVVDSADGNTGNFKLEVKYDAPACGDGVLNAGEQCDPANPTSEDGCHNPGTMNQCMFGEPPPDPALVQCPGGLITITAGDAFQLSLLNNGSGGHNHQNVTDMVDCLSPAIGPENVFNVKPGATGMLTAQIGYAAEGTLYCDQYPNDCGDFVMYIRKGSCASADPADQLACDDFTENPMSPFGYDEVLNFTVPVTAGEDYWLFVDGLDDTYGIGGYFLELSLQ